jgi:hypothetical protein
MGRVANIVGKLFMVPLENKGYALGLAVRQDSSIILGYFSKKYYLTIPQSIEECKIDKKNICLIAIFGILGIKNKEWTIIGNLPEFDINDWGIPEFAQKDDLLDCHFKIIYDDNLEEIKRVKINETEAKKLFSAGVFGYGLIEAILSEKLCTKNRVK